MTTSVLLHQLLTQEFSFYVSSQRKIINIQKLRDLLLIMLQEFTLSQLAGGKVFTAKRQITIFLLKTSHRSVRFGGGGWEREEGANNQLSLLS